MFAMATNVLIFVLAAVLFGYWFRYSCLLLRRTTTERAEFPIADDRFSIRMVLDQAGSAKDLGPLERALERDYYMLNHLLKYAADLRLASVENRMLMLDYRLMRLWYVAARSWAPRQCRPALVEMASALGAVARKTSQQTEEIA